MTLRPMLAALLLSLSLHAVAGDAPTVNNATVPQFLAWHDEVAQRAAGRDFEALSRAERRQLADAQAEIRRTLDGKASMSDLDDAAKIRLFNAQERVVALVNKAEDERLVCSQRKRLGSHRHQLECRTVAQMQRDREAARTARLRTGVCDPALGSCGGN
jgi:hypothetical protein